MSTLRVLVVAAALVAVLSAALALASRAPVSLRLATPPPGAVDPSHGAHFTPREIARNGRFQMPGYLGFLFTAVVEVVVLVLLARGPVRRLVDAISSLPGGWPLQVVVAAGAIVVVVTLATLPLAYVTGYARLKAWGLSTQDIGGWLSDQGRSLAVGVIVAAIAALAFYGVVRWQPRWWWLWGWVVLSALTVVLTYLYPVAIAPLFNRFTPLHDERLVHRIDAVAQRAGVHLDRVLVADASRRTTAENAYVAGLGGTKELVLYDTLLHDEKPDGVVFVAAHEIGHDVSNHVLKGLGLAVGGMLVAFAILAVLARAGSLWSWAGAAGVGDPRSLPVLLLFALVVNLLSLPIADTVSRHFEATADRIAVTLTDDPRAGIRVFRRFALHDLADLRPPGVAVTVLFTHPPITRRIQALVAYERGHAERAAPLHSGSDRR